MSLLRCSLVIPLLLLSSLQASADLAVLNPLRYSVGDKIDSLNGVTVYYNGLVTQAHGRNTSKDGYNLGLKYQCVEFVKRYYYSFLNHRFPDTYGHAKDFFDKKVEDGGKNRARNL